MKAATPEEIKTPETDIKPEKAEKPKEPAKPEDEFKHLKFELAVCHLLHVISQNHYESLKLQVEKYKIMRIETIERKLKREHDQKTSLPDAVAQHKDKILVIDAKNHSAARISVKDVEKLWGDVKVRNAHGGMLVIQEKSKLTDEAYQECQDKKIMVVQLKAKLPNDKDVKGIDKLEDKYFNKKYLIQVNIERIIMALKAMFGDFEPPKVLFTKEGKIDGRSWVKVNNSEITNEELVEKYEVKFKKDETVDKRCKAYKVFEEYEEIKEASEKRYLIYQHVHQRRRKLRNEPENLEL